MSNSGTMHQRPSTYSQLSKSNQTDPRQTGKTPSQSHTLSPSVTSVVKGLCAASAAAPMKPSSEGAKECSPPRKRWGSSGEETSPSGATETPDGAAQESPRNSASSAVHHSDEARLQAIRADIKSLVLKNLFTNPVFARFYVDLVITNSPNSNAAKIFRRNYKKILDRISLMPTNKTCTHIKVSGVRCGGPALRGEQFCYFHQHAHRSVRRPPFSRLHPIAIIEDEDSIQVSLMEVINGLVRNTLDAKRAALILRALHIAVKNASRVRLDSNVNTRVREIPEYAAPPEEVLDPIQNEAGRAVLDEEAELPAVAAKEPRRIDPQDPNLYERMEEGGRQIERRTAQNEAAAVRGARAPARQSDENARTTAPPPRKPPTNSQERKNTAQRATAG